MRGQSQRGVKQEELCTRHTSNLPLASGTGTDTDLASTWTLEGWRISGKPDLSRPETPLRGVCIPRPKDHAYPLPVDRAEKQSLSRDHDAFGGGDGGR